MKGDDRIMDLISIMPWIWLGILVVLLIIEAATMGITTIWGAISALIMIFVSKTGMGIHWQVLLFLVMTLALLFTTRPLLVKKLKLGRVRTNVDSMLLQEVVVTKTVSRFDKGEAKSRNGVIWTVASNEENDIPVGTVCTVKAVEGNTLIIKRKEEKK